MPTVAQNIVAFLEANGVHRVFGVPGESYLDVLDSLYDSKIEFVNARQEGGAAMMAEAHGKISGCPGVCMVTRGPGATNASAGVHIAQQDSTPMILFVGQISRHYVGRDAFQEVDYQQFFGGMAKAVISIDVASRCLECLARAWSLALSGRPGPVVVVLPEDVLGEQIDDTRIEIVSAYPSTISISGAFNQFFAILENSERPVGILGCNGLGFTSGQVDHMASNFGFPLVASFRRQGELDWRTQNYAGDIGLGANPRLVERIEDADTIVLFNAPMSEIPSQGYKLLREKNPNQKIIQITTAPDEIGRYFQPDLALVCDPDILEQSIWAKPDFKPKPEWIEQAKAARSEYLNWSDTTDISHPGAVQMPRVIDALRKHVPDAVMTNGAGNYAGWLHRFWRYDYERQVAPTSGSMGYGLPAAIATKLEWPAANVVCWAGDGCLQMTIQEMATAAELGLKIIVLVIDNGMYGTIRMHQENHFPGRVSGTKIRNPDFAAIARGYGWEAHTVQATGQFEPALTQSLAANGPSLIHIHLDPEAITPTATLQGLRDKALKQVP